MVPSAGSQRSGFHQGPWRLDETTGGDCDHRQWWPHRRLCRYWSIQLAIARWPGVVCFFFNDKQTAPKKVSSVITLPETNSSHLKMDGWNTIVSFWDGLFSRAMLVLGGVIGFGGVLRFP